MSMMPIVFSSLEQGAPVLNNAAAAMIAALDACLVTGFNVQNVSSVSVSNNVATITTTAAHGYLAQGMWTAGGSETVVGNRVTLSDMATAALNADFTVLSVPSPTTFTVAVTLPNGSYTGSSPQVKRTPLGWSKPHSAAGKAVYARTSPQASAQMLRVAETATDVRVIGVESATGVDNYTNPFPTPAQASNGYRFSKGANSSTAKNWVIVGDEFGFYLIVDWSEWTSFSTSSFGYFAYYFGDIKSFKAGDAYHCTLWATNFTGSSSGSNITNPSGAGYAPADLARAARGHNGILPSVSIGTTYYAPLSSLSYPSPVDNGLLMLEPVLIMEGSSGYPIRGTMPGLVCVLCRTGDLAVQLNGQYLEATDGSGLRVIAFRNVWAPNGGSVLALKVSAPWS